MPAHTSEEVDRIFGAAISAGDLDAAVDLYEDEATVVSGDGVMTTGREAIRSWLQGLLVNAPALVIGEVRAVGAGDIALLQADWTLTGRRPDGTAVEGAGRSVEVVRRQADGSWRFVIDLPNGAG